METNKKDDHFEGVECYTKPNTYGEEFGETIVMSSSQKIFTQPRSQTEALNSEKQLLNEICCKAQWLNRLAARATKRIIKLDKKLKKIGIRRPVWLLGGQLSYGYDLVDGEWCLAFREGKTNYKTQEFQESDVYSLRSASPELKIGFLKKEAGLLNFVNYLLDNALKKIKEE